MKSKTLFRAVAMLALVAACGVTAHAEAWGLVGAFAAVGLSPHEVMIGLAGAGMVGNMRTFDQATVDSTGVFFQTELTRLNPTLVEPLADFPYARDVDLTDLDLGDEVTAYDAALERATGGINPAGKSIISARTTVIGAVNVDLERVQSPTFLWGELFQMSIIEIERAMKLGRPLSPMLLSALKRKWELDTQGMVYLGDASLGVTGLVNSPLVTAATVAAGVGGLTWALKTPDEILTDVNTVLDATWAASGYTRMPTRIGLPPAKLSALVSRRLTNTNVSVLEYLKANNIAASQGGVTLEFAPMRELIGAGAGSTDRMIAYSKSQDVVRYPRTNELRPLPTQFDGLFQKQIYVGKLGTLEIPRPALLRYADGF